MNEVLTKTLYYNSNSILHSLQPTILSYAKSNDTLFHSNLYKELLAGFDENHDGIIDHYYGLNILTLNGMLTDMIF